MTYSVTVPTNAATVGVIVYIYRDDIYLRIMLDELELMVYTSF